MLILGVLMAAGLAILLAMAISRGISSPIAALAATARALGRGGPVRPPDAGSVAEVHEVGRALMDAAAAVREREEALRAADRAKDDFLAMLGHELRNPLSALSSAAQILQQEQREGGPSGLAAAVIDRQVRHMTRLIDDLLDVARVTTGKVRLAPRPLDLAAVVAGAVQVLRSAGRLDEHDVRLDAAPIWIAADEARVEQIVSNLVGNAVKYTPPGGRIDVRVLRRADDAVLEVSDTGVGLSPELAPRVFDLFVQGEQSIDRAAGGLGLGLTLVKRLAELQGGRVGAASAGPGRGTTFTVGFPAIEQPVTGEANAPAPPPLGDGRRVLLIEDNDDAREVLRSALTLHGYEVCESADGAGGLETAAAAGPEAAVVDIGLPGIDGYEVARRLRATAHGASLLLIAISGYGQPEARRRAFEAGFDEYVTKPVPPDVLAALIASGLDRRDPGYAAGSRST
jgi:signal transduction histidine kinase/ActR/RegA family two-component response regulator